jgi:hypothetical protein
LKIIRIILVTACFILCVGLAIYFNQSSSKVTEELHQERYTRMLAEENLDKLNVKKKSLEISLNWANNKIEGIEKMLDQKKKVNTDLQSRLEKTLKLKSALEQTIKEFGEISAEKAESGSQTTFF